MSLQLQCLRKGTNGSTFADTRKQSLCASNYYDYHICRCRVSGHPLLWNKFGFFTCEFWHMVWRQLTKCFPWKWFLTAFNKDFPFSYALIIVIMNQHHKHVYLQEVKEQLFSRLPGDILSVQQVKRAMKLGIEKFSESRIRGEKKHTSA